MDVVVLRLTVAVRMDAATGDDGDFGAFAYEEVVINQTVHIALCDAGGNKDDTFSCEGDVDFQPCTLCLRLYFYIFRGLSSGAAESSRIL